jgi:hypothetical protein
MSSTAKHPVDFVLQVIQHLSPKSSFENLSRSIDRMGMDLFNPPGVNGWNHSDSWLATARYRERFNFAQQVAAGRTKRDGGYKTLVSKLLDPAVTDTGAIVDGLLERFGVRNVPAASRQALIDYLDGGVALSDEDWLEIKFRGVLVLIFTLPEFQVH